METSGGHALSSAAAPIEDEVVLTRLRDWAQSNRRVQSDIFDDAKVVDRGVECVIDVARTMVRVSEGPSSHSMYWPQQQTYTDTQQLYGEGVEPGKYVREGTVQEHNCGACGNSHSVTCSNCNGSREVYHSDCGGRGWLSCPAWVDCSRCGGSGQEDEFDDVMSATNYRSHKIRCRNGCDNGKVRCERCDGTGHLPCRGCGSTGRVGCPCGNGQMQCPTCNGVSPTYTWTEGEREHVVEHTQVADRPLSDGAEGTPAGQPELVWWAGEEAVAGCELDADLCERARPLLTGGGDLLGVEATASLFPTAVVEFEAKGETRRARVSGLDLAVTTPPGTESVWTAVLHLWASLRERPWLLAVVAAVVVAAVVAALVLL